MNKNHIRGRRDRLSWHNTAKACHSVPEVKMWRSGGEGFRPYLGNGSEVDIAEGKSRSRATAQAVASHAAMRALMGEKSAEVIVAET